jgi:hypothetical protein
MSEKTPAQIEAKTRLDLAAAELRALLGTPAEHILDWKLVPRPGNANYINTWEAKVGSGKLILWPPQPSDNHPGVSYTSSFGPHSDKSFTGFLPGLNVEEAMLLAYQDARRRW